MTVSGGRVEVALLGFGTVGRAVARQLMSGAHPELQLRMVCTRRPAVSRAEAGWVPSDVVWTDRFDDVLASDCGVVVEVMGGLEPARDWMARALASRRSVVTANKQVLAASGPELVEAARTAGVSFRFEAAVGGVIPVLRGAHDGLAADRLTGIGGVLNGTCNFVLGRMEHDGLDLDTAVAEAQARGYAEADPSADLDGLDARAKLVVLAAVGLHRRLRPDAVPARSIRTIEPADFAAAGTLGCTVRQIAWAEVEPDSRVVRAAVTPALVDGGSWFARVAGARNTIVARGPLSGETVFAGEGAGGDPTAVAVVSDLLTVSRAPAVPRSWPAVMADDVDGTLPADGWYVRVAGGTAVPWPVVEGATVHPLEAHPLGDVRAALVEGPSSAAERLGEAWRDVDGARVVRLPVLARRS